MGSLCVCLSVVLSRILDVVLLMACDVSLPREQQMADDDGDAGVLRCYFREVMCERVTTGTRRYGILRLLTWTSVT